MFPDSRIAADFRCKHTKTKAIICDTLDPHLKELILQLAKAAPFNLLCDESNERGDHVKLLTILVRLYDPAGGMVVTRHVDTVGITDLSAEGIFTALKTALEVRQIPFSNLMSFTSDTCNVMKGKKNGVIAKLRTLQPRIIDIDCVCHLVSLCVKTATKQLPLKVDELLVDIYYHFRYSVKRISSLQEYADFCTIEYKTILRHCETRWLSLRKSIQRTLHMWDPLCSYFQSHCDVEKPGKVRTINVILQQPQTKLWLCFLSNVLAVFDKFNVFFQTTSTSTIHKLHGESERLLRTVLSFYIKPCVILQNSCDLTAVDYADESNVLSEEDIYIGDNTPALLLHLKENEGEVVGQFYQKVIQFYQAFVKKQLKSFEFQSSVLRCLTFLDPDQAQRMPLSTYDQIADSVAISFDKHQTKLEHRDFATDCSVVPTPGENAVDYWYRILHFQSPMGEQRYKNLATLALQLLSIPASNADSERVFSLVRRIKTDFRASLQTETISALIGCHFNKKYMYKCCEQSSFEDSLLAKAKSCTNERNISYKS